MVKQFYMIRSRRTYILWLPILIAFGLLSRRFNYLFPNLVNTYLGDATWAAMIYVMMAIIFSNKLPKRIAMYSLLFCYVIEISQLYQAPWINAIRNSTIGALVLGSGFLWSDLLAYALGIGLAFFTEKLYNNSNF